MTHKVFITWAGARGEGKKGMCKEFICNTHTHDSYIIIIKKIYFFSATFHSFQRKINKK